MQITSGTVLSCLLPPARRLCFRRCLSVCLLATLRKNFPTDLHEIFREGWQLVDEQMTKFWCRSESRILIRIWIRKNRLSNYKALTYRREFSPCFCVIIGYGRMIEVFKILTGRPKYDTTLSIIVSF